MNNCEKCFIGYKPSDVDECPKCNGVFCAGCMKNHGC